MSPVKEADPAARELDTAFAEAMGAQPRPAEPGPPPETDPDAPFGRDEAGVPLEPYGRKSDGTIRRSAGGRKPKDPDTAARTGPPADDEKTGKVIPPGQPRDFTEGLNSLGDGIWVALSVAGKMPLAKLPLVPEDADVKLRAEARLVHLHKPALVRGLNVAAEHNASARRLCERLDKGDITWVLTCAAMFGPFAIQSLAMWKNQLPDGITAAALAGQNDAEFDTMLEQLGQQMEQAVADAAAAAAQNGHAPEA